LQDALEQHRPFDGWLCAVFFGELEHRVLNDIECVFLVAHGENRLLESAAFYAGEKVGQFLA
jgi:hypothetical protein